MSNKYKRQIVGLALVNTIQLIAMVVVTSTLVIRMYEFRDTNYFERQQLEKEIYNLEQEIYNLEEKIEELELEIENLKEFNALVSATFRLETGNGSSYLWTEHNNAGGIKCGVEYCSYSSKSEGMVSLAQLLERYVDKYGYDLEAIRYEYCGSHCGDGDLQTFTEIFNQEKERRNYG